MLLHGQRPHRGSGMDCHKGKLMVRVDPAAN
jgi:hypothetical protein